MMPKEDKIFGAFLECLLTPLEGVPTYEYMTKLTVYLNLCLLAVDFTLGCGTLGYLGLTAQPAVFNTHCVTKFITPRNPLCHEVHYTKKSRDSSGHAQPSSYGRDFIRNCQDTQTQSAPI